MAQKSKRCRPFGGNCVQRGISMRARIGNASHALHKEFSSSFRFAQGEIDMAAGGAHRFDAGLLVYCPPVQSWRRWSLGERRFSFGAVRARRQMGHHPFPGLVCDVGAGVPRAVERAKPVLGAGRRKRHQIRGAQGRAERFFSPGGHVQAVGV